MILTIVTQQLSTAVEIAGNIAPYTTNTMLPIMFSTLRNNVLLNVFVGKHIEIRINNEAESPIYSILFMILFLLPDEI